jgi:hypothetical protein
MLEQAGGASIKATWLVPNAGHVQAASLDRDEYVQRVTSFFDGVLN